MAVPVGHVFRPLQERFEEKVERTADCWLWRGHVGAHGYGQIFLRRGEKAGPVSAHRVAYELYVGPVPDGLEIDHLCRNRACVNPAHLEAVTRSVNVRRGTAGGHNRGQRTSHCLRGHPRTPENTYVLRNGRHVHCRVCGRLRKRWERERNRALSAAEREHPDMVIVIEEKESE